ncbi:hypothetical protein DENSPDRAFT_717204 [Dentipellis sp. KUC8613]|nr:hypothetical protein DENSPDRAFT_717204 [Dentipellis sp. KUC8613]
MWKGLTTSTGRMNFSAGILIAQLPYELLRGRSSPFETIACRSYLLFIISLGAVRPANSASSLPTPVALSKVSPSPSSAIKPSPSKLAPPAVKPLSSKLASSAVRTQSVPNSPGSPSRIIVNPTIPTTPIATAIVSTTSISVGFTKEDLGPAAPITSSIPAFSFSATPALATP